MKSGIELIAEERQRQIDKEGWSPEHDDKYHSKSQLAFAASCYATGVKNEFWPWSDSWWKPSSEIRNKIKAGALYQAEVDRLLRKGDYNGWVIEYLERIKRIAAEIDRLQVLENSTTKP